MHRFFWVEGSPTYEFWYWCSYNVDFIKTDAGWKIWHLHVYQTWASEVGKTIFDGAPPEPPIPNGPGKPDEPLAEETKSEWTKRTVEAVLRHLAAGGKATDEYRQLRWAFAPLGVNLRESAE